MNDRQRLDELEKQERNRESPWGSIIALWVALFVFLGLVAFGVPDMVQTKIEAMVKSEALK